MCVRSPKHLRAPLVILAIGLAVAAILCLPSARQSAVAAGNQVYVDSVNGNDANNGLSPESAWRTFEPLYRYNYGPGDAINLARGSNWNTGLRIERSGVEGSPIIVRPYGDGAAPALSNINHSGTGRDRSVYVAADWVIVEGLYFYDALSAGVWLANGSDHNIVRGCEAYRTGAGVTISGQYNLVTGNYFHDLVLEFDSSTGSYGGVGVNLYSSNNEISYNTVINARVPSMAFGVDGGGVEFYNTADGNYIHHNYFRDVEGFIEVGGGAARNNRVTHNVVVDSGRLLGFHVGGAEAAVVENFVFEHNTVADSRPEWTWSLNYFMDGTPSPSALTMRNNINHVVNFQQIFNSSSFVHDFNTYSLPNPTTKLGFTLSDTEMKADPQFVDLGRGDLRLTESSPARGTGRDANGGVTDLGALPYGEGPTLVGIYPSVVPASGGSQVILSGTGFADGTQVTVAGQPCVSTTVRSPFQVTCAAPAVTAGVADVVVTSPDGRTAGLASGLVYVGPGGPTAPVPTATPVPTSTAPNPTPTFVPSPVPTAVVTPTSAPSTGPVIVDVRSARRPGWVRRLLIAGSGFDRAALVSLNGATLLSQDVVTAFEIVAEVGIDEATTVTLVVTNPDGTSSTVTGVDIGGLETEVYLPAVQTR